MDEKQLFKEDLSELLTGLDIRLLAIEDEDNKIQSLLELLKTALHLEREEGLADLIKNAENLRLSTILPPLRMLRTETIDIIRSPYLESPDLEDITGETIYIGDPELGVPWRKVSYWLKYRTLAENHRIQGDFTVWHVIHDHHAKKYVARSVQRLRDVSQLLRESLTNT